MSGAQELRLAPDMPMLTAAVVVIGKPPNYARICEVLGTPRESMIYAYGNRIYASHVDLDAHLLIHENVHRIQQEAAGGPEPWWDRYLEDRDFRLAVEVEAYRAQYQWLCARTGSRQDRRHNLRALAGALSDRTYGKLCSRADAMELLRR